MTGSPRFLGSPLGYMPCSQIPAGRRHQAIRCLTCCLPLLLGRRLPRQLDVGTQSHSLQPRCLRFATRVTPAPRKTRFRLAANLDRMGLVTHRTPKMVSVIQYIHPPSPSFPSAQEVQAAARTEPNHLTLPALHPAVNPRADKPPTQPFRPESRPPARPLPHSDHLPVATSPHHAPNQPCSLPGGARAGANSGTSPESPSDRNTR